MRFNGEEIARETPHARARRGIGYVPQGRDVFPRMSVEENLLVGLSISGERSADFEPVYSYFPILKERRRQAAGTLSGGQQQQLAIGRVLVGAADLLAARRALGRHPAFDRAGHRADRRRAEPEDRA